MAAPNDALVRSFQAMGDSHVRTANLTALIASLSPWERRHVRLQLGGSDGLARFEALPTDLVCLLIPLLHLEDILSCSAVSKKCRSAWSDPSVAAALSIRFFPGLQPPFTFSAFRNACHRYFRRRAGKFTSRIHMALPPEITRGPTYTPYTGFRRVGSKEYSLPEWTREFGGTLTPDPTLHPEGKYPDPWPAVGVLDLVCYGGGNIVWYARPKFLVVDNLYARTRKVIRLEAPKSADPDGFLFYRDCAAASKSLVVLHDSRVPNKVFIYNLETNVSSWFHLPSRLNSIVVRGTRIYLMIIRKQIIGLEHDGSRVLCLFNFWADKGMHDVYPDIDTNGADALVYPHPHLPDRFFVALLTKPRKKAPGEGIHSSLEDGPIQQHLVNTLVVREFNGEEHIATYLHNSQRHQDPTPETTRPLTQTRNPPLDMWERLCFDDQSRVLDPHGLCATGLSWVNEYRHSHLRPADVPPLPRGLARYYPTVTFSAITRRFGFQRYASPDIQANGWQPDPWDQQVLIPWIARPGLLKVRRFDAENADFVPSRDGRGEREVGEGWSVEVPGLAEHMAGSCEFYHDEDFAVLFIRRLQRYYVWGFVEEGEGKGKEETNGMENGRENGRENGSVSE